MTTEDLNLLIKKSLALKSSKEALSWFRLMQEGPAERLAPNLDTYHLMLRSAMGASSWTQIFEVLSDMRLSSMPLPYSEKNKPIIIQLIEFCQNNPATSWRFAQAFGSDYLTCMLGEREAGPVPVLSKTQGNKCLETLAQVYEITYSSHFGTHSLLPLKLTLQGKPLSGYGEEQAKGVLDLHDRVTRLNLPLVDRYTKAIGITVE